MSKYYRKPPSHWRKANLTGADLTRVDLRGADLSDADFSGGDLEEFIEQRRDIYINGREIRGRLREATTILSKAEASEAGLSDRGIKALSIFGFSVEWQSATRAARQPKLISPPGSFARSVLAFLFSKKGFDNVFAQAIVDMREEHADALANKQIWKARWIVLRDHLGLVLTVSAFFGTSVVKRVAGIWKMIP